MPKLIATRALRYRGQVISTGASFEPSDAEANEFVTKKYATREMVAKKAAPAAAKPAAEYQRRDMRANEAAVQQAATPMPTFEAPKQAQQPAGKPVGAVTSQDFAGTPKQ
jgi:hypothetical protein